MANDSPKVVDKSTLTGKRYAKGGAFVLTIWPDPALYPDPGFFPDSRKV